MISVTRTTPQGAATSGVFTISPQSGQIVLLQLFVGGQLQTENVDYSFDGVATITFVPASIPPVDGILQALLFVDTVVPQGGPQGGVFDTVNSVLNAARVRLNDAIPALEATTGNLLDKSNSFAQQATNNAWRRFCSYAANRGFTALKQEVILSNCPVVQTQDPAIPCWVDWSGFFDGVSATSSLTLPVDLLIPYKVWQRPTGQNAPFPVNPMELFIDGLPDFSKQIYNAGWEWRANRIYLPGALQKLDLRILYGRYLGDFVDVETPVMVTQWFEQTVPIPNCQDAFALGICAELALAYPDKLGDPQAWLDKADAAADLVVNREVSMKQRGTYRKRSRSGRLEGWA